MSKKTFWAKFVAFPKKENSEVKKNGEGIEDNKCQEKPEIVALIQQFVTKKLLQHESFTVHDLCRELGMSYTQLHRGLKAATGQPASKIIRACKIDRAKDLLKNRNLTLTAVAIDAGFYDPDYFFRVFKQEVGLTPTQYRNRNEPL